MIIGKAVIHWQDGEHASHCDVRYEPVTQQNKTRGASDWKLCLDRRWIRVLYDKRAQEHFVHPYGAGSSRERVTLEQQ